MLEFKKMLLFSSEVRMAWVSSGCPSEKTHAIPTPFQRVLHPSQTDLAALIRFDSALRLR